LDPVNTQAFLNRMASEHRALKAEIAKLTAKIEQRPITLTEEIDSIPGRRIFFNLSAVQTFTVALSGQRGQPMNFLVSQDGAFVQTHYPMTIWRPSGPANATQFGWWRPISDWPLPDQVVDGDRINLSYEFVSGGSQRNFQNLPAGPVLSRPDNLIPLPCPTLFTPNETIQFIPTYESINFDQTLQVPTTTGTLQVTLPGYRIVNM
jgi:hypothetical protein